MTLDARMHRIIDRFLLGIILAFTALHFVRLAADFPWNRWQESAAYTDEGWWSSAAVNAFNTGHWNVIGGYNPGVATPVFPAVLLLAFKLVGPGLFTARSVESIFFALFVLFTYLLASRLEGTRFALLVSVLFSVSYFTFSFGRLALLEFPMLFLVTAALYVATCWSERPLVRGVVIGLLLTLAFLTKMSAIFALAPIAYLLYERSSNRSRFMFSLISATVIGGVVVGLYAALALSHYAPDFQTFMHVQKHLLLGGSFIGMLPMAIKHSVGRGIYMGSVIYPLGLLGTVWYLCSRRGAFRHPLFVVSFLWLVSYLGYLTIRLEWPPRYYVVLYWPIICLLLESIRALYSVNRQIASAIAALVFLCALVNANRIVHYIANPQYTFYNMTHDVHNRILKEKPGGSFLLGGTGATISLENYIPSISDGDYHSKPIEWVLSIYCPGYFISGSADLNTPDLRVITDRFRSEVISKYNVFGNNAAPRNIYLYKLYPRPSACQ